MNDQEAKRFVDSYLSRYIGMEMRGANLNNFCISFTTCLKLLHQQHGYRVHADNDKRMILKGSLTENGETMIMVYEQI